MNQLMEYSPTAGDMEREPEEPVGEGVGRITCWGLGVPGGPEPMPLCAPPLELSLLFCPISSWNGKRKRTGISVHSIRCNGQPNAGRQVALFVVFIYLNESDSNYELTKRQPQLSNCQRTQKQIYKREHMTEIQF